MQRWSPVILVVAVGLATGACGAEFSPPWAPLSATEAWVRDVEGAAADFARTGDCDGRPVPNVEAELSVPPEQVQTYVRWEIRCTGDGRDVHDRIVDLVVSRTGFPGEDFSPDVVPGQATTYHRNFQSAYDGRWGTADISTTEAGASWLVTVSIVVQVVPEPDDAGPPPVPTGNGPPG
jgi:hypothetical protein